MVREEGRSQVLVAGGGVAALEALIGLRQLAGDRVTLGMLAPEDELVYRPLSTGDPFALGATQRYPLADLCGRLDVERHRAPLESVDAARHRVHAGDGAQLGYDRLIVAVGARAVPAFEHALTFGGPDDVEAMHGLVRDVESGYVRRIAFIVPDGVSWPLPAYELSLLTAARAYEDGLTPQLTLVTAEPAPLAVFGSAGSRAVQRLLTDAGVAVETGVHAAVPAKGRVRLGDTGRWIEADRVVALPRLRGPRIRGLPADSEGFVPIDDHARVLGVEDVYAAGDAANFPVKQGGIATQQADAAVEEIAAAAGAPVEPRPLRPVLRGILLTGERPRFMRYTREERGGDAFEIADRPLWWPPGKIAGRYLSPFLGNEPGEAPAGAGVTVDVPLDPPRQS